VISKSTRHIEPFGLLASATSPARKSRTLRSTRFGPKQSRSASSSSSIRRETGPPLSSAIVSAGNGHLSNVIGNPLETSIALSHLIFDGTLDRYPGIKICAAHGGGYLPSYAARSDLGCKVRPDLCHGGTWGPIKKRPTEYLRQMYYDTMVFSEEGLRHLVAEVGADRLMIGTDYPYPWTSTSVEHVLDSPHLSDAQKAAILGGTAATLLGIAAA